MTDDGLERVLKGLEGRVVGSVDIERQGDFLHVKIRVLDTKRPLRAGREISFTVMWKKTVDRLIDGYTNKLDKISSKLKEHLEDLKEHSEDLKKVNKQLKEAA